MVNICTVCGKQIEPLLEGMRVHLPGGNLMVACSDPCVRILETRLADVVGLLREYLRKVEKLPPEPCAALGSRSYIHDGPGPDAVFEKQGGDVQPWPPAAPTLIVGRLKDGELPLSWRLDGRDLQAVKGFEPKEARVNPSVEEVSRRLLERVGVFEEAPVNPAEKA